MNHLHRKDEPFFILAVFLFPFSQPSQMQKKKKKRYLAGESEESVEKIKGEGHKMKFKKKKNI